MQIHNQNEHSNHCIPKKCIQILMPIQNYRFKPDKNKGYLNHDITIVEFGNRTRLSSNQFTAWYSLLNLKITASEEGNIPLWHLTNREEYQTAIFSLNFINICKPINKRDYNKIFLANRQKFTRFPFRKSTCHTIRISHIIDSNK